ncbi:hypothetical protein C0Q70_14911 [Pomacea canaliculata]|uniref:Uncharacterized protein n=1 Tax=Pomacea canaliculata TaxID=400727 RepID=A0A2T7NTC5_POMCA|nr:hypothetical protein C0Q70_14911 [Pomacea canaliculata]
MTGNAICARRKRLWPRRKGSPLTDEEVARELCTFLEGRGWRGYFARASRIAGKETGRQFCLHPPLPPPPQPNQTFRGLFLLVDSRMQSERD